MANIGIGEAANSIPTIVAAEALGYLQANTVMLQLVARDWDNEVAQAGNVITIPFTGALSVNDKAADTVVTLQNPSDTAVTVTLDKHKEVSFIIEDPGAWFARPDLQAQYISDAMAVMAEQIDADLTALYTGLSQTIDATAGLGETDFREARRLLNSAKAPLGNRAAVLHEDAEFELLALDRFISSDYSSVQGEPGPTGLVQSYAGKFMGFDVFMDQKITIATAQAKNLFFHKNAFVLATRPMASAPAEFGVSQVVMAENGIGLRVTMSYNADHLGVQVTIDVLYGVKELRDSHGVSVSTTEI